MAVSAETGSAPDPVTKAGYELEFEDTFDGPNLDRSCWSPYYLPHWSSRAESAATYTVEDSELRLTIPAEQGLWCPGVHEEPLRVSGVQSGVLDGQR